MSRPGIDVRVIRENGPGVGRRPADQPFAEPWPELQHRVRPAPAGEDRDEHAGSRVELCDEERVARDQLHDAVRDSLEQLLDVLVGQQVVIDRRQTAI